MLMLGLADYDTSTVIQIYQRAGTSTCVPDGPAAEESQVVSKRLLGVVRDLYEAPKTD
jgi:hypothetical protein